LVLFYFANLKVVGLVLEEDDISDTVLESQRLAMQHAHYKGASSSMSSTFTRNSTVRVKVRAQEAQQQHQDYLHPRVWLSVHCKYIEYCTNKTILSYVLKGLPGRPPTSAWCRVEQRCRCF